MTALDLTGRIFGRLTAIRLFGHLGKSRAWLCACSCGNESVVRVGHLTTGRVLSCGCYRIELNSMLHRRHGHCGKGHEHRTRTYESWRGMVRRCTKASCAGYPLYGGRGITVCERWRGSFESFLADMGECPSGMSIDRVDVNGNYEPGNCRWSTSAEQAQNKRNTVLSPDQVNELRGRREHGESVASISRRMRIARHCVSDAILRRSWSSLP